MKRKMLSFIAAVSLIAAASVGFAATDQVVRIPYVVNVGGWSTGLAITNLSDSTITGLTLDLVKEDGTWHSLPSPVVVSASDVSHHAKGGPVGYNFRVILGFIAAHAIMVNFLESIYGDALPDSRMWCEIWHNGAAAFAVTVFVMNVITGQAEGFGFHPFFSEAGTHTFPTYEAGPSPLDAENRD
jgi:hypothetical protein